MKRSSRYMFFSIVLTFWLVLSTVSPSYAQTSQWAVKMFSEMGTERIHDFGSVALHANVEQHFQFKNIYNEDVVVSSVSSNCGCTKASATKTVIRPNEIGEIVARVDTSGKEHTKQRKATIRVMFSKPSYAEVQLQVKTYIRPDVGFEPGIIDFGSVRQGESVVKKAFLQYEGRPDWALISVQKTNAGVRAEAHEVKRQGGSVVYEIFVELKSDAKPGYIHDLLKFQTNEIDRATSSIFLPLQGLVVEPLSAKPSHLQLGIVEPNTQITKNLVISGSTPFKIVSVSSSDPRLSFLKTDLTRTVHVVPVTFKATGEKGDFSGTIVISTQQGGTNDSEIQKIVVEASGFVLDRSRIDSSKSQIDFSSPEIEDISDVNSLLEGSENGELTPVFSKQKEQQIEVFPEWTSAPIQNNPPESVDDADVTSSTSWTPAPSSAYAPVTIVR